MQQKQQQPHIVDIIFVLALFGAFAFSAVMLIIAGSTIYKNTLNNMQANFETRTSSSYISEKMRQGGEVEVFNGSESDILSVKKSVDDRLYATYLYCRDGYLCELYSAADSELTEGMLAAGQRITELSSLKARLLGSDSLVEIVLKHDDGSQNRLILSNYHD